MTRQSERSRPPLVWTVWLLVAAACCVPPRETTAEAADASGKSLPAIEITIPAAPPEWALLQRRVLDGLAPAAAEFVDKYTREDGTLIWRDRWPGMDGSDDGYESFYNFPLYYALGGPEEIHRLSRRLWEAVHPTRWEAS